MRRCATASETTVNSQVKVCLCLDSARFLASPQVPSCWSLPGKREGSRSLLGWRLCIQWEVKTAAPEQTGSSVCCFCSLITATFSSSALVTEEVETGTIELTFDLPDSSTLKRSAPVVLLALEAPPRGEILDVTFSSQSLQPDAQVSNQTQVLELVHPVFVVDIPSPAVFPPSLCASRRRRATCC